MKRKGVKGLFLGLGMMILGSVTALAAPSITGNGTVSQDFVIDGEKADTSQYRATFEIPLDESGISDEVLQVISQANEQPEKVQQVLQEAVQEETDPVSISDLNLLTEIQDLSIVDQETGEIVEGLTNVTLTWEVPSMTEQMKNIRVLHYSQARDVWEILIPDQVDYANKAITQTFTDLSPVAVLYTVEEGTNTSPGTGDSPMILYYAAVMILAFGICLAVIRKRVKR